MTPSKEYKAELVSLMLLCLGGSSARCKDFRKAAVAEQLATSRAVLRAATLIGESIRRGGASIASRTRFPFTECTLTETSSWIKTDSPGRRLSDGITTSFFNPSRVGYRIRRTSDQHVLPNFLSHFASSNASLCHFSTEFGCRSVADHSHESHSKCLPTLESPRNASPRQMAIRAYKRQREGPRAKSTAAVITTWEQCNDHNS